MDLLPPNEVPAWLWVGLGGLLLGCISVANDTVFPVSLLLLPSVLEITLARIVFLALTFFS